ncbi:hypothetical protein OAN21_03005 [Alphaproteobacteria bacterium]|nr:hypothetical protein [Alphaproteobacteria bacterium]
MSLKKQKTSPFPIRFDLKSYTVLNYVPLRRGGHLDHLLGLEKWAGEKGIAAGLQGEGVFALLDGRVDLSKSTKDPSKHKLSTNIIFSFEFKNSPRYEKRKFYFRLSEEKDMTDKEVQNISVYIQKQLGFLEEKFLFVINTQFPALKVPTLENPLRKTGNV